MSTQSSTPAKAQNSADVLRAGTADVTIAQFSEEQDRAEA